MSGRLTLLKALLIKRHQVTHRAFCLEYDKVARSIDRTLIGSSPSKEAFNRWVNGRVRTKPQSDHCRVLERMFPGHTVAELLAPYDPGTNHPSTRDTRPNLQEATTNRREVFHLGAATMALGLTENLTRGPDLLEQVLDTRNVSEGRLLYLEDEADRLGERVVKTPPTDSLSTVLVHLGSIRELLAHRQPIEVQRRLVRVGAKLSLVVGEIMFCANQWPSAQRWYTSAARAAEEAGDRYLADIALASAAYLPTYSADPQGVLSHVMPRLESATNATPAIAWMWGFAAMAHAALGDRAVFERTNHKSRVTLERCPADLLRPGIFSFLPEKQAFYEARGWADLGEAGGAEEAATRALVAFDPALTSNPALVRFSYATALAKAGQVEQACHIASAAIHDPHTFPTMAVVLRAHEFDALLTRAAAPPTVQWREALAGLRSPDLAMVPPGTM